MMVQAHGRGANGLWPRGRPHTRLGGHAVGRLRIDASRPNSALWEGGAAVKQWQSVYRSQAFFSAAVVVAITIGSLPGVSPLPTPRGTTSVRQVAAAGRPP